MAIPTATWSVPSPGILQATWSEVCTASVNGDATVVVDGDTRTAAFSVGPFASLTSQYTLSPEVTDGQSILVTLAANAVTSDSTAQANAAISGAVALNQSVTPHVGGRTRRVSRVSRRY